ncbi:MAG: hypothetical protein JNL41_21885 [Phenylobacterium sp.]|uniref:glycosyltransferase family 9 protein n=1 Tax=Phenylobacterium sp. TaxID=1871053 RepID=UPI001A4B2659|nr:glycosyltransferase family 9 protein [Phenylobacterium sp.]MBL8556938.1 hypothetical protein [Phenylobacterium sp.]
MTSGRVQLPPSEHWKAAMQLLAKGEFELGWKLWETRPIEIGGRVSGKPALAVPEWDGSDIGSLLILPEQGLGDQIMFARYAPLMRDRGVATTIMCHPLLARLFETLGVPVLNAQGRVALPPVDAWALGPSMPYLCGTRPETIPPAPYLSATPRRLGRIGVQASGNPNNPTDVTRSLPPELAQELLAIPDAFSLEHESTGARDLRDTAEIIAGADLVIAVDTAVAHLAGALGKPCWLMIPRQADWRWMRDRADSPWYPSIRLFRQPVAGDWASVVAEVKAAL